jgi:hypothetical protein
MLQRTSKGLLPLSIKVLTEDFRYDPAYLEKSRSGWGRRLTASECRGGAGEEVLPEIQRAWKVALGERYDVTII